MESFIFPKLWFVYGELNLCNLRNAEISCSRFKKKFWFFCFLLLVFDLHVFVLLCYVSNHNWESDWLSHLIFVFPIRTYI